MRAVGGADLDEFGARSRHDIGDAEAAANLDKLAAADDDLLACGMGRQHQQHRGGVVVDHERVLGTGKRADELSGMFLARPARAGVHAVLERAVAARDLGHGLCRRLRERGTAQVGMDNDTRGVDGGTQARQRGAMRTPLDGRGQVALRARGSTGANGGALLVELVTAACATASQVSPAAFTTGHSASSSLTEGMARRRARTSSDMFWLSLI